VSNRRHVRLFTLLLPTDTVLTSCFAAVREVDHGNGNRTCSACGPTSNRAKGQLLARRPIHASTANDRNPSAEDIGSDVFDDVVI